MASGQTPEDPLQVQEQGRELPPGATGRLRLSPPMPSALPPVDRHYVSRANLKSPPKTKTTVILPGTDVPPDLRAIREGRAMRDGPFYVVGERYYEMKPNGRVFPVQGPGFVLLDRGAFRALCIYNTKGETPAAERMLDLETISEHQRSTARAVRGQR